MSRFLYWVIPTVGTWPGRSPTGDPAGPSGSRSSAPLARRRVTCPSTKKLVSLADPTGELDPDLETTYRSYFVVQTAKTLRRFQEDVGPSASLVDEEGLMRIFPTGSWRTGRKLRNPIPIQC